MYYTLDTMDRVILHCDMNNFFASVELLERHDLDGKPVAVCGNPESRRGIILAKNQLAKEAGVVTAETVYHAQKKCPGLMLIPPHHEKYREFSKKINSIYLEYTDMVEPFSIDESWLDVTASRNLFGSGRQIADTIRNRIRSELGLTLSAGVSFNKVFAKMGSEYKKPDATTEITRDNFKDILWPQDISKMFFVGKATAVKLRNMGINTIGDLACANPDLLSKALGKHGSQLWAYTNGLDKDPVLRYDQLERIKSVGNGTTFSRNLTSDDDILTAVTALSDRVGSRLRADNLKCSGVKVDIKDPSFHTISRQKQLMSPTNISAEIKNAAMELITASWPSGKPIRLLAVTGINLVGAEEDVQLSFFSEGNVNNKKGEDLDSAMDDIRKKFGDESIVFGQIIKNDIGVD